MKIRISSTSTQLLAAVSVFKTLYDQNKDVFDVLSVFIKYIINKYRLYSFNEHDISEKLNEEFSFSIPSSVINTTLKNRVKAKKQTGIYIISPEEIDFDINIENRINNSNKKTQLLLEQLESFVSKKLKRNLSETELDELSNSLCLYQLNSVDNSIFSDYISEFIIRNDNNSNGIIDTINETLEGLVIYNGIMNAHNLNEIGVWRTKQTIFCDMDILFSLYGYNGTIFKDIVLSFKGLVDEVNCNSKSKNFITLKYFKETKREINRFFETAVSILDNKENIDPSKPAMSVILNGCSTKSDILLKKAQFFEFLEKLKITEDENSYYENSGNNEYNLISKELTEKFVDEFNKDETYISLIFNYINYINILREGDNSKSIETTNFIFLTSNYTLIKMDCELKEMHNEICPKTINLDNLITLLWFNLKKGFGDLQNNPSLNVVNKAKIIISSKLNSSVSQEYFHFMELMKENQLDEKGAALYLVELHKYAKLPEQITSDYLKENGELIISRQDIEARINEASIMESRNKTLLSEKEEDKKTIQILLSENNKLEKELQQRREEERKKAESVRKIKRIVRV